MPELVVLRAPAVANTQSMHRAYSAGRMWVVLPAPALLPRFWRGTGVGSGAWGPGLTSESADAARAVLRDDLSAGPQFFWHPPARQSDLPGLDKRPGFTVPTANGCVPSLNHRKGWL